jgi:hypothetical protein
MSNLISNQTGIGSNMFKKRKLRPWLWIALVCFLAGEIALRLSGRLDSYAERIGLPYVSAYTPSGINKDGFYLHTPDVTRQVVQSEFQHKIVYNKMGLRGPELPRADTAHGRPRILVMGDSFTESRGVEWEKGWPMVLQSILRQKHPTAEVLGAGIGGADPVHNYHSYLGKLRYLKPNVLILAVNNSDIYDLVRRGGIERIGADSKQHLREGPEWEVLFEYCYWVRFFALIVFRYDWNLIPPWRQDVEQKAAISSLTLVAKRLDSLQRLDKHRFLLVIFPTHSEAQTQNWYLNWADSLKPRLDCPFLDISKPIQTEINRRGFEKVYYPIDGHFTATGYQLLAETVAKHPYLKKEAQP